MITLSKLAIAGAVAAFAIASPAFGQSFDPTAGTGNVLPYAYNGSGATGTSPTPGRVARAASGLNAYAMIRHEGHGVVQPRALYDYGFDAPGYARDYSSGPSGYDPSIETQR